MSAQVKQNGNREIHMYNNYQAKCISYKFSGTNLKKAEKSVADYNPAIGTTCNEGGTYNNYTTILSGITKGSFKVDESNPNADPPKVGKVTVTIQIGQDNLQTSVSFMNNY